MYLSLVSKLLLKHRNINIIQKAINENGLELVTNGLNRRIYNQNSQTHGFNTSKSTELKKLIKITFN